MKKVTPEEEFRQALEEDDNLAILKAHRKMIFDDLLQADEFSDRTRLSSTLTQINKEIIKLEGAKSKENDDFQEVLDRDAALRDIMRGDIDG